MASAVLDASAVLALIRAETGWDRVLTVLPGAVITAVNAAEVYAKLAEWQLPREALAKYDTLLVDRILPFDADLAKRSGALRPATKAHGLGVGDRACLALAQRLAVPAWTADRAWAGLQVGIAVELVR